MDVQLNFSDVVDLAAIGTQYASQGLTFSENAIALQNHNDGGQANFLQPVTPTLMTYRGDGAIQVGVLETLPAIISAQLTLRYTSPHLDHAIQVLNADGVVINNFVLAKTPINFAIGGEFDSFQTVSFEFNGDWRLLRIGSFANQLGIDEFALNLTFDDLEDDFDDENEIAIAIEDEIEDDIHDNLDNEIEIEIEDNLDDQIEAEIEIDLGDDLDDQIEDDLDDQIEDDLEVDLGDEIEIEIDDDLDDDLDDQIEDALEIEDDLEVDLGDEIEIEIEDDLDDDLDDNLYDEIKIEDDLDDDLDDNLYDEIKIEDDLDDEIEGDLDNEIEEEEVKNPIAENNIIGSDTIVGTPNDDTLTYGEVNRILVDPEILLGNDQDPQGEVLTLFGVSESVNGVVSLENDEIIFIPDEGFLSEGSGQFQYGISNESGGTATATATILNTIPQVFDARGGDNILQLKNRMVVDLSEADDQTPEDTLTVLNFNHVIGSSGDDSLRGNDNDNLLIGGEGDDTVIGVNGDNTLIGMEGTNVLIGGDGDDLIIAGPQDQISGGDGVDTLLIDVNDDVMVAMPNNIEVLITGEGNDSLIGTPGSDSIISAGGNNTLDGGGGGDFFMGGPGGDVIIDTNDPDTFVFQDPTDGADTLLNQRPRPFPKLTDNNVILISADGFGGDLTPGFLPSEQFTLGSSASDPNHRFILDKGKDKGKAFLPRDEVLWDEVLYYDPDGDGPEPQVPILVSQSQTFIPVDLSERSIVIF